MSRKKFSAAKMMTGEDYFRKMALANYGHLADEAPDALKFYGAVRVLLWTLRQQNPKLAIEWRTPPKDGKRPKQAREAFEEYFLAGLYNLLFRLDARFSDRDGKFFRDLAEVVELGNEPVDKRRSLLICLFLNSVTKIPPEQVLPYAREVLRNNKVPCDDRTLRDLLSELEIPWKQGKPGRPKGAKNKLKK